jgi:hypothetical protein
MADRSRPSGDRSTNEYGPRAELRLCKQTDNGPDYEDSSAIFLTTPSGLFVVVVLELKAKRQPIPRSERPHMNAQPGRCVRIFEGDEVFNGLDWAVCGTWKLTGRDPLSDTFGLCTWGIKYDYFVDAELVQAQYAPVSCDWIDSVRYITMYKSYESKALLTECWIKLEAPKVEPCVPQDLHSTQRRRKGTYLGLEYQNRSSFTHPTSKAS